MSLENTIKAFSSSLSFADIYANNSIRQTLLYFNAQNRQPVAAQHEFWHSQLQHQQAQQHHKDKRRRQFTHREKEECWQKAPFMLGRHPDRWRLDAFGNPVTKGGETSVQNCQILTTKLNRFKSDATDVDFAVYKSKMNNGSSYLEYDVIERAIYGDIKKVDMSYYGR